MLTVITDDLVIDMEQVLYLSRDAHPYTLRFRGGAELELTTAEGQALIAKLQTADRTVGHALVPGYPGGSDPFETHANKPADKPFMPLYHSEFGDINVTVNNPPADGAPDTGCDNKDEIDPDEYKYAVEVCGVPVEAKAKPDEFGWIAAKDCEVGKWYVTIGGYRVFCVRSGTAETQPLFLTEHFSVKSSPIHYHHDHRMRLAADRSW